METAVVEKKFANMGARIKFFEPAGFSRQDFTIDVKNDKKGEYFEVRTNEDSDVSVLDVQEDERHLLLLVKRPDENLHQPPIKMRFLCGHDERNWFTCAIPGTPSSVFQAKQALKPSFVQEIESKKGIKQSQSQKRHRRLKDGTKVHRQGEFMFTPDSSFLPPEGSLYVIHRNEPLSRGGNRRNANPHMAQYLYRSGGISVWVSSMYPNGVSDSQMRSIIKEQPALRNSFTQRQADANVWVKGTIRHSQHATLDLGDVWHRVSVNTEDRARGAVNVRFLD